jgi:hypothetical protein
MVNGIDADQWRALAPRLQKLDVCGQWPRVAGQRPSSLNASGLIVEGRSSTQTEDGDYPKAVVRDP